MPREAEVNMQRNGFFWGVALLLFVTAPVMSAEPERSRPPIPEELSESWERFQRALHEWGGRMWERLGPRGAREDRPVISQMLNNKEALGLSSDQVRRLEQLRDNFQRQTIRNEADLRIMELDIAALLDSEPVRIARIRAIEQGKALLNADQKKKLTELMRQSLTLQYPKASQNPSATERGQPSR
jgi:hypothetical protein